MAEFSFNVSVRSDTEITVAYCLHLIKENSKAEITRLVNEREGGHFEPTPSDVNAEVPGRLIDY